MNRGSHQQADAADSPRTSDPRGRRRWQGRKVASISIIEVRTVGRFGRMFVSGSEAEVRTAVQSAGDLLESMAGQ